MFMRRRPLRRVVGVAAVGAVVGGGAYYAGKKSAQAEERKAQPSESAPSGDEDKLEQLKKLGELRDAGTITEEEFEREKQKIMAAE